MSILELIKTRRSIREFTDDDISDAAVEKILEAARWAPSGLNNQPWRFVVVKNETNMPTLSAQRTMKTNPLLSGLGELREFFPFAIFIKKENIYPGG